MEEFNRATGDNQSSALNAIGVMSKIELQPGVVKRRHQLSEKIAAQLEDSLNTVVPVGAGLRRALDDDLLAGDRARLTRLLGTLRRIPRERLEVLLADRALFREFDFPDSPGSAAERQEMVGGMPWAVFTTIAREISDHPELGPDEVAKRLEEISGFERLWKILEQRFIERGHILRCHRIANDARTALDEIRYKYIPEHRRQARENKVRLNRFIDFIRRADDDPATAGELEDLVRRHVDMGRGVDELQRLYEDLRSELGTLLRELEEYNEDFGALQQLEEHKDGFTEDQLNELRSLLGRDGFEIETRLRLPPDTEPDAGYVGRRQQHWTLVMTKAPNGTAKNLVAERAYKRYGSILGEIKYELERRD